MDISFNKQKLELLLKDLSLILKTPVSVFDKNFNYVTSNLGLSMSGYCNMVRSNPTLNKECINCDLCGCKAVKDYGIGVTYKCHAHLIETVEPIFYDDEIIGYIMFGQYRTASEPEVVTELAKKYNFDESVFLNEYNNLTVLSKEQVEAIRNILKSCVISYYLAEAVSLKKESLIKTITIYINNNLSEKLTADIVAEVFYLNKKQLYALFSKELNLTFYNYVNEQRIQKAKELLLKNELCIADIAFRCGYLDYNYFIQKFKKEVGVTPLKYKKQNSHGNL